MKPMSPEEQELKEQRSRLSGHYRAGSTEEPPAHLDAAILAAARREVERSRFSRNWHLPASIAAVLVIGVSLALMISEIEDPLPPPDTSAGVAADVARQAAPALAMKQESQTRPAPRPGSERESRPSREAAHAATVRRIPGRIRLPGVLIRCGGAFGRGAGSRAGVTAVRGCRAVGIGSRTEECAGGFGARKARHCGAARGGRAIRRGTSRRARGMAEENRDLLRNGKTEQAREQLAEFRKRYPDYRLPETLRELEAVATPNSQ
jgi:hypothetical protein